MSIVNKKVGDIIDDYMKKMKIKPNKLKTYLKEGSNRLDKLISKNNLTDVVDINRIFLNMIDEKSDSVLRFENFKLYESDVFSISNISNCLYKGIDKSDIKMEKILADYFDTNLSHIDNIDSEKHIFTISNWSDDITKVIIYSNDEFELITENIKEYLYDELNKSSIKIENISINLLNLIKKEDYVENIKNILTNDVIVELISNNLQGYKYDKFFKNYHIFKFV